MPCSREIAPDFRTGEAVIDCAPMTRLLCLGLWNFADDFGVQPLRPAPSADTSANHSIPPPISRTEDSANHSNPPPTARVEASANQSNPPPTAQAEDSANHSSPPPASRPEDSANHSNPSSTWGKEDWQAVTDERLRQASRGSSRLQPINL